jgi:hypothetical protein
MSTTDEEWTVDNHLKAGNEDTVAVFEKMRALIDSFGPGSMSVSKTTVTFKGTFRGTLLLVVGSMSLDSTL